MRASERLEQCGTSSSKSVSGASEGISGGANGQVLYALILYAFYSMCAMLGTRSIPSLRERGILHTSKNEGRMMQASEAISRKQFSRRLALI